MTVRYKVRAAVTLYKKSSDGSICIDKVITKSMREESEEYQELVVKHESEIGFLREDDPKKFDKELLEIVIADVKKNLLLQIDKIKLVLQECYLSGGKGCCELFGVIFNPIDFCAMEVQAVEVEYNKK